MIDALKVRRKDSIEMQNSDEMQLQAIRSPPLQRPYNALNSAIPVDDQTVMNDTAEDGSPELRLEDLSRGRTGAAEKGKRGQVLIQIVIVSIYTIFL